MGPLPAHADAPHYRIGRRWRVARRAGFGLLVAAVVAVLLFGPTPAAAWGVFRDHAESWREWSDRNPVPAVAAYFAVFAVATALPLPILTLMSLAAGALFGTVLGAAVASLAYTVGVTVCFLAARWLLRDHVRKWGGGWIRRVQRGVERDGAYYLLTLRLIPSLPFFLVNVLVALTPIPTGTYAFVSWVGSLPFVVIAAGVGTGLASLESPGDVFSWAVIGGLLALAALPLVIRALLRLARPAAHHPGVP